MCRQTEEEEYDVSALNMFKSYSQSKNILLQNEKYTNKGIAKCSIYAHINICLWSWSLTSDVSPKVNKVHSFVMV